MALPFEDYVMAWEGKEYVIPAREIMGAIAKVERIVTLSELQVYFQRGAAPLSLLAQAYGAVLRYAGAKIDDGEVYAGMFGSGSADAGAADAAASVKACLFGLLHLMIPPAARGNLKAVTDGPPPPQTNNQAGVAPLSKKRSSLPSATRPRASSRRTSSGISTRKNSIGGSKP